MVTENNSNIHWIIPVIVTVFLTLVGTYLITLRRDKHQKEATRIQKALENHFSQEMTAALHHIGQRSGLKVMPERKNDELVFDSDDVQFASIERNFPLNNEQKEAFNIHFPEIAEKWNEMENRALKLKEDNQNNRLNEVEFREVGSSLAELSKRAKDILVHIRKNNRIGTKDFHYNKKCPICKKF